MAYYAEGYVTSTYAIEDEDVVSLAGCNVTAFQPDAFQWGFQIMDTIPTFVEFPIARHFKKIHAGQAVLLPARVADIYTSEGVKLPFNPSSPPQIQIYYPDGTIKVPYTDMVFLNTGLYGYEHQSSGVDPVGVYTGDFSATNGQYTSVTVEIMLFEIE